MPGRREIDSATLASGSLPMSSAVIVTPRGAMFYASMNARTPFTIDVDRPLSCVPPLGVGMPLAYVLISSSVP